MSRIQTTHVGSLPRSQEVTDLLFAKEQGKPFDQQQFDETMTEYVNMLVRRQTEAGIDVVSDGETSKISYATYVKDRYSGFSGDSPRNAPADLKQFPGFLQRLADSGGTPTYARPMCTGEIKPLDNGELEKDIANLYMNTRSDGFGDEVKKRILIGTHVLSAGFYDAYYLQAQKVRRMIKVKFEDFFKDVDLIFMPTTLDQAFEKNRKSDDPNRMYKEDLLTIPANLAGLPAISFPNGFKNNLPIGGQLIGKYFGEDLLLNTTNKIQEVTDWHKMTP